VHRAHCFGMKLQKRNADQLPKCIFSCIIRYYGISCRVVMAASARLAAIHGQICTATRHNKRRPLNNAAPPSSQSDRPLNTLPPTAVALQHTRTSSSPLYFIVVHFPNSKFSPPPRILTPTLFKRSDATQPDPSLGWSSESVCFYY